MASEYEVMYTLRGAQSSELDALRDQLSELGHSVVIVGDQAIAQVHAHLGEAGAAIEAALPLGDLSQIRITALPPSSPRASQYLRRGNRFRAGASRRFAAAPVLATESDVAVDQLRPLTEPAAIW
jgi:dihydroxyacetone kinase-like predicted kinase